MYLSTLLRIFPHGFINQVEWHLPPGYKPTAGDIVKVTVLEVSSSKLSRLELCNNGVVELKAGDVFIGVLGSRAAVDYLTGHPPQSLHSDKVYTLNIGGVIGEITQATIGAETPPKVKIDGLAHINGEPLNTLKYFRSQHGSINTQILGQRKAVVVLGDGRSSGKTSTLASVAKVLAHKGIPFGTMKLTGIARKRDSLQHGHFTNQRSSIDFIDCGLPSSVIEKDVYKNAVEALFDKYLHQEDLWLIELGAGLLSEYNVETAIELLDKRFDVIGYFICAKTRMAAYGCYHLMKELVEEKTILVSGPVTNSASGSASISKYSNAPIINIFKELDMLENDLKSILQYVI